MVYGLLDIGEISVSNYKIRVEKTQNTILYSRFNEKRESVASSRIIEGNISLSLLPIEPVSGPLPGLIECIYVRLSVPVVVDSRVELSLTVPVDYGIVAYSGPDSYAIVDSFHEQSIPYKLALYGPPTQGVICRYHLSSLEKTYKPGLAQVDVVITNNTGSAAVVKNMVIPLGYTKVFYKQNTWMASLSSITVALETKNTAVVRATDDPPSADFDESPDIVNGNKLRVAAVIWREGFRMLWGY